MIKLSTEALSLPAAEISEELNNQLKNQSCAVITAPPGAGKSTLLPLTILQALEDGGKVVMLEPRRLAARQIAERMVDLIGEPVGKTVGYRVRFENKVSADTRIEVLTEGILTRMLVDDPTLEGVSVVIFDEFHERSITSDVALALTREAQQIIRPDLKIVVMSATIDTTQLCAALNAPLIESKGRMFPVDIIRATGNQDIQSSTMTCAEVVARAIIEAHGKHEGDILAFLPGQADIMKCQELLGASLGSTNIFPLYGLLSNSEQKHAISPSRVGERKVVLATSIAETSLTIEGVKVVIDSGLCRKMVFDQQSGMSHLETVQISMDMATQRSGRAGRVSEGTCYRLWSIATEHRMEENRTPEIAEADLMPMLLDIAAWGEGDVSSLTWLTPPPPAHVAMATEALKMLGALSDDGQINKHGKALAKMPCHPRIAQMLVMASSPEEKALACDIAALMEEKDPLSQNVLDSDINTRIAGLRKYRSNGSERGKWERIERIAKQYRTLAKTQEDNSIHDSYSSGRLLACAYPERVATALKEGLGRFSLASGDRASVDKDDIIAAYDWIAIANVNTQGDNGRIFLASPLAPQDLKHLLKERDNVSWDARQGAISARKECYIGRLVVESRPIQDVSKEDIVDMLSAAAPKYGLSMFDFNDNVQNLQRRIAAVAEWHPEMDIPDLSTENVLARTAEWLPYYVGNSKSAAELKKIDMTAVIWSLLSYEQQMNVDRLAPTHILMPNGRRHKVEYRQGAEQPIMRIRLQECFGMEDTPRINDGKMPVLMELLSPGFKPVQLTQDLKSFWNNTYFEVRKELRRRYPKHQWPENPANESLK